MNMHEMSYHTTTSINAQTEHAQVFPYKSLNLNTPLTHPPHHAYPTTQTTHGYPNETLKTNLEGAPFTF